jgi:hypothetical protein
MKIISRIQITVFISTLVALLLQAEARSQVMAADVSKPSYHSNVQHCCVINHQQLLFSKPMVVLTGYSTPELPHLRVVSNGVLYLAGPSVKLSVSTGSSLSDINVTGGSALLTFPIVTNLQ